MGLHRYSCSAFDGTQSHKLYLGDVPASEKLPMCPSFSAPLAGSL